MDLKAYSSRLKQAQADTGLKDAVINARGKLNGRTVIVSSMEYAFIGGSMGAVVGEAITRAIEQATETRVPIVIVSASGGARMMEGVVSLMQLAKISAALARLDEARVPFISVLTEHGMLDAVVHRRQLKSYISRALEFMDQSSVVGRQASA